MTQHDRPGDHLRHGRHDRLIQELEHDPYHDRRKLKGPARGIGEALHHAYQGELNHHHETGEFLLRVGWSR